MIKSELVQMIADKNPHLYHRDIERIVNVIFDEIIEALHEVIPVPVPERLGIQPQQPPVDRMLARHLSLPPVPG